MVFECIRMVLVVRYFGLCLMFVMIELLVMFVVVKIMLLVISLLCV